MFTFFITIAVVVGGLLAYFFPALLANQRKHPNQAPIFLLNLFLGWTLIGWVMALVWAASSPTAAPAVIINMSGAAAAAVPGSGPMASTSQVAPCEIVFCARCGKKREGTLGFCRHCGATLA